MPELPEVETVKRALEDRLLGHTIMEVEMRRPNLRWPMPDDMAERLRGKQIEGFSRRSKYIWAHLSGAENMLIHLGMSGRVLFEDAQSYEPKKHDHVLFYTDHDTLLVFCDPRRFGMIDVLKDTTQNRYTEHLGVEPLSSDLTAEYVVAKLKGKQVNMKAALMDQRIIAGLGNIYVCEALFRAGINPTMPSGKLSGKKIEQLVPVINQVLEEAIVSGGSTIRDYVRSDGELGYFQHKFQVYGRENEPCIACSEAIERITQQGRSTFYCPSCQR